MLMFWHCGRFLAMRIGISTKNCFVISAISLFGNYSGHAINSLRCFMVCVSLMSCTLTDPIMLIENSRQCPVLLYCKRNVKCNAIDMFASLNQYDAYLPAASPTFPPNLPVLKKWLQSLCVPLLHPQLTLTAHPL